MTVRPPNPDALVRWIGGADQQLRHLQSSPPMSWENIRYGDFQAISADGNGNAVVPFATPFDHQCFVVTGVQVGTNGAWWGFVSWHRPGDFGLWISTFTGGSFVGNCQITYLALGF